MGNLVDFAKNELKLLRENTDCKHPLDIEFQEIIEKDVLELISVFENQGHSGSSAPVILGLFKKLARWKPVTELKDDNNSLLNWIEVDENLYQHRRDSSVFKKNGIIYKIDGKLFSDDGGLTYFTNQDSKVIFDLPGFAPEQEFIILGQKGKV
jgi:hypothetical protein